MWLYTDVPVIPHSIIMLRHWAANDLYVFRTLPFEITARLPERKLLAIRVYRPDRVVVIIYLCVSVCALCVCVRERERESVCVCFYVCVCV